MKTPKFVKQILEEYMQDKKLGRQEEIKKITEIFNQNSERIPQELHQYIKVEKSKYSHWHGGGNYESVSLWLEIPGIRIIAIIILRDSKHIWYRTYDYYDSTMKRFHFRDRTNDYEAAIIEASKMDQWYSTDKRKMKYYNLPMD